jgi:hypothetical protein
MKTKQVFLSAIALAALLAMLACSFFSRMFSKETDVQPEQPIEEEQTNGEQENLEPIIGAWRQVNFQGIGGSNNILIGGAAGWFGDYYYVGTMNAGLPSQGACGGEAAVAPAIQAPQASQVPQATEQERSTGAELWRTRDGDNWEVVGQPGLGVPEITIISPFVFQNRLYVSMGTKTTLLVSDDGDTFETVPGEWSNSGLNNMMSYHIINDSLLMGGYDPQKGLQAWFSTDGKRFNKVIEDGLGDSANYGICGYLTSVPLNGWHYLGVSNNVNGGELWRTRDGRTYEKSLTAGYDDTSNSVLCVSLVHDVYLYVTMPGSYGRGSRRGVDVIRSADGKNWEKIIENGFSLGEGQGYNGGFQVYKDALYFVLWNFPPESGGPASTGFRLWKSLDGKTWEQIGEPGFGYPEKHTAIPYVIRGVFYLVAYDTCDGNQLWRSTDGTNWELFQTFPASGQQFGAYLVEIADGLEYFEGNSSGVQIWRYGP